MRTLSILLAGSMFLTAAIRTGPNVGAKFPNFEAADQNGKVRKLPELLGPNGGLIVVYRSADW